MVKHTLILSIDPSITWEGALQFIRESTNLPVWIKGGNIFPINSYLRFCLILVDAIVYTVEDVELAIKHGLDGVVISNHAGRQLDGVPATLDVLRECAPVAKGKIVLAIDSGIRRGTDIFKAIALGADFCFAGRVPIWGLAVLAYVLPIHEHRNSNST